MFTAKNKLLIGPAEGATMKAQMKNAAAELKRIHTALNKALDDVGYVGVVDIQGKCWVNEALRLLDAEFNFIVGTEIEPSLTPYHIPLPLSPSSEGIKALVEYRQGAKELIIEAMSYWAEDQSTDLHDCLSKEEQNTIKAKATHVIKFIQAIEFKHHLSMKAF